MSNITSARWPNGSRNGKKRKNKNPFLFRPYPQGRHQPLPGPSPGDRERIACLPKPWRREGSRRRGYSRGSPPGWATIQGQPDALGAPKDPGGPGETPGEAGSGYFEAGFKTPGGAHESG